MRLFGARELGVDRIGEFGESQVAGVYGTGLSLKM